MALWHDHTSVTGQKSNSGLVAEQSREGINDLSIDDSNVYIQSFHHTTGSNPFIPQSINFSISHFNFIDDMDNRTSVRSQSILPPPLLRERQVVLPTENPPTILPSQHHIFHREVPTHLSAHYHHFSPLYSQSMFNNIRTQFHRVHLYRQSVFNLIRTQYRRLTVCSKINTWKSQVSKLPNVKVPFLKIPVSKVPILQKCPDRNKYVLTIIYFCKAKVKH